MAPTTGKFSSAASRPTLLWPDHTRSPVFVLRHICKKEIHSKEGVGDPESPKGAFRESADADPVNMKTEQNKICLS